MCSQQHAVIPVSPTSPGEYYTASCPHYTFPCTFSVMNINVNVKFQTNKMLYINMLTHVCEALRLCRVVLYTVLYSNM